MMTAVLISHACADRGCKLGPPWVWLDAEAGYQLNFSTDLDTKSSGATDFMVEPANAPYLKLGIFVSPPDSFLK